MQISASGAYRTSRRAFKWGHHFGAGYRRRGRFIGWTPDPAAGQSAMTLRCRRPRQRPHAGESARGGSCFKVASLGRDHGKRDALLRMRSLAVPSIEHAVGPQAIPPCNAPPIARRYPSWLRLSVSATLWSATRTAIAWNRKARAH